MQERTDANLREMMAEIKTNREEMTARLEAKIEANNEKFEVLRGTLRLLDGYPPSQDRVHSK
jgi:hypothetical protein